MQSLFKLEPEQSVGEKPFTEVELSQRDLAYLEKMRSALPSILAALPDNSGQQEGALEDGAAYRAYRVITTNKAALLAAPTLFVVGFCGTRQPEINAELLAEMDVVDGDLVAELQRHPSIACYASLQIEDGNWRNLVLLLNGDGVAHWRESVRHLYATEVLSPKYYTCVRLHNGTLEHGLQSERIQLISTKYYDFQSADNWRAIRAIEQKTNIA